MDEIYKHKKIVKVKCVVKVVGIMAMDNFGEL